MKNFRRSVFLLISSFLVLFSVQPSHCANGFGIGLTHYGIAYDGANIWVANYSRNSVTKLRATDGSLVEAYKVPGPWGMAFDGKNIWVANYSDDTVTKLRARDGALMGVYPVGVNPRAVLFDGKYIWVASGGVPGSVTKLRTADGSTVWTQPVADPWGMAYDGSTVWVTNNDSNRVTRLDSSGCVVGKYKTGDRPLGIAFDGSYIWVADNGGEKLTRLSAIDGSRAGKFPVGVAPFGLLYDGHYLWVARTDGVLVKLSPLGCLLGTYDAGGYPEGIAFDGNNVWVSNTEGAVKIFRAYSGSLVATCNIRQPCEPRPQIGEKVQDGQMTLARSPRKAKKIVLQKNALPENRPRATTPSGRPGQENTRMDAILAH
ncbi:MAG: YncE family protein [Syntrophobacteraceae bacterium]|nr:YncE family protein [Syntrophobacteraceae bacterium]